MNIPGSRLIVVPLLCGSLLLAVQGSDAKEKAKPSPTPRAKTTSTTTTTNRSQSSSLRTASPKTSATPTIDRDVPNKVKGIDFRPGGDARKQKFKAKTSPTPKPKR